MQEDKNPVTHVDDTVVIRVAAEEWIEDVARARLADVDLDGSDRDEVVCRQGLVRYGFPYIGAQIQLAGSGLRYGECEVPVATWFKVNRKRLRSRQWRTTVAIS